MRERTEIHRRTTQWKEALVLLRCEEQRRREHDSCMAEPSCLSVARYGARRRHCGTRLPRGGVDADHCFRCSLKDGVNVTLHGVWPSSTPMSPLALMRVVLAGDGVTYASSVPSVAP